MGVAKSLYTAIISSSSLLLIALILLSSPSPAQCIAADADGGHTGGRRRPELPEWEILTKRNFASQIRLNPHILLMVTVPWSGEARSLMKEVSNLVAGKEEEFRYIKLMVVFRNSEKMLADALGAPDGITLFYYHHSTSYKYQGRLRGHHILSSVYHFMTHPAEETPLKSLHTRQELDNFSQSTDKSILLLEFCGWSADLLRRANHEDNKTTQSVHSNAETVGLFEENHSTEAAGKVSYEKIKNQKIHGLKIEELTCRVESGLADPSMQEGSIWTNQTGSHGTNYTSDDAEISCTVENYYKFKSFFLEFMKIAKEYFLPPERHRFGLISERSLLPFLDVGNPQTWLVVFKFAGCSNCSMLLHEGDDLRTILQTHHTLVEEVDADGSLDLVFPANRPSVILFIDRSSDSSRLRGESKLALQVLRKFVEDSQFSDHIIRDQHSSHPNHASGKKFPADWSQIISDNSLHHSGSVTPKLVGFQDNMAITLTNRLKRISVGTTADDQGNSLYDILSNLLNRKKPAVETKETKISLLAKEVGFQLLSDDFEVQAADSLPAHNDDSQLSYIHNVDITSMGDQTSKLHVESKEASVVSNTISLDSNDIASINEEKQSKHTNEDTHVQQKLQNQQIIPYSESNIDKLTSTLPKELEDGICSPGGNDDHKSNKQEDLQSFMCPAKYVEQEWHILETPIEDQNIDQIDCNLNKTFSNLAKQNLTDVIHGEDLVGSDADVCVKSATVSMSDEWNDQQIHFKGSFFFSDGGYRLLRSLTGAVKIPSLVILDPVLQEHYVYPEETDISYSSLDNFIKEFLNGSLNPFQRAASIITSSRESPRPPFVNLDFHEADSIPRVTTNMFCELIVGYSTCKMGHDLSLSHIQNFSSVWKRDVLVLFCTSWCGFCQRMELVVREVYRAFKNFTTMLKSESPEWDAMHVQDKAADTLTNGLPLIYLMDCTLNECSRFLKPIKKRELYPALWLYPAENKTAIAYEGDMSVVSIIEFLISHGRNSHFLTRHEGFLCTRLGKGSKKAHVLYDEASPTHEGFAEEKQNEILLNNAAREDDPYTSNNMHSGGHHVVAGSVLSATDELLHVAPFYNSTILIVTADKIQGFQGMIINKQISWDIFKQLDQQLEPLKKAPLFYGGPVSTHGLPMVSLARKAVEGYVNVTSSIYYGNPLATRLAIEGIRSGYLSAYDFWFFLGYSSWTWNQLFEELAAGAWHLSESTLRDLHWPET